MPITADKRRGSPLIAAILAVLLASGLPLAAAGSTDPDLGLPATQAGGNVRLVRSDSEEVILELTAPGFRLGATSAYAATQDAPRPASCRQLDMPGFVSSAEEGLPALPVKVVLLGAPPDAELEVVAEPLETSESPMGATICPAPTRTLTVSDEGRALESAMSLEADPEVYAADAFYPSSPVRVVDLGFMRSQRIVRLEIYPLQYNPASAQLRLHAEMRVRVRFRGDISSGVHVTEPSDFESAFRRSLLNYETASGWRSGARPAASKAPWVPPQPAYKVIVDKEGLYQISQAELAAAGLPVGTLDPRTFRLYNAGQELAIAVSGQADGRFDAGDLLLFYGQGVNTRYTGENVYWLTYGGAAGLRMADLASAPASQMPATHTAKVRYEQNLVYISSLPKASGYDHWYGERLQVAGAGNKVSRQFTLSLPYVGSSLRVARISAALGGNFDGVHHVRFSVNGQQVYDGAWSGRTVHQASASFTQGRLKSGDNAVTLELINDTAGQAYDMIYVDWIEVEYEREYVTDGDWLAFGSPEAGSWLYQVTGFTAKDVEVYNVTDAARVNRVTGLTVGPPIAGNRNYFPLMMRGPGTMSSDRTAGSRPDAVAAPGPWAARFGIKQTGAARFLALTPSKRASVLRIEPDPAADVLSSATPVDYVVVAHRSFITAAQALATHRASQGLRVKVVDVQEIYDQFGYGLMSAEAIRDFVAYAYSQWPAPAPTHVLLVGDGTYDFRGFTSFGTPTFVPPYLEAVDPDTGETATDNRYVSVTEGDILPDLNIGRLPVNTAEEAGAMVDKIVAYEALAPASWMARVLFVADDLEGGGGDFYEYSDSIADGSASYGGGTVKIVPAGYTPDKVYLGRTCDLGNPSVSVECRAQIIDRINAGTLLVSYIGHGTRTYWATEKLFDKLALSQLSSGGRPPVMLPMTCNEGYFHDPDPAQASLSETAVRIRDNGPIASWAPTGFGLAPGHDYLEKGLLLALFHDRVRLGAAATQGKLYLVANTAPGSYVDLIDTFLLLGDPALRVPVQ